MVWDATAQRQILRLLFLPIDQASKWTFFTRQIGELDSAVRNLHFGLTREERALAKTERFVGTEDEVRQQLHLLQQIQESEQNELEVLEETLVAAESQRQTARVNALTAEQAYESASRMVEHQQLAAIEGTFPNATATAKYILAQILTEQLCQACGSSVPQFAEDLRARVSSHHCIICNSETSDASARPPQVKKLLTQATKRLDTAQTQKIAAEAERQAAEGAYQDILTNTSRLIESTARRAADMDDLVRRLPSSEREMHQQRSELAVMRSRLERQRSELQELNNNFERFVGNVNLDIAKRKNSIKRAFDEAAKGFLFEDCQLIWQPRRDRIGQSGKLIEFAAFELDMGGANFDSPVRRTGPEQVSESQREFIDLAFRISLMRAASEGGGSLIVDAPESSLDAVFVTRAADVLIYFGKVSNDNRLVITSNLIDGDLLPALVRKAGIKTSHDGRVVDLLEIAAPTAAIRSLRNQYADVRRNLFKRALEKR